MKQNRIIRLIALFMVVIILLFTLTGCGSNNESSDPTATTAVTMTPTTQLTQAPTTESTTTPAVLEHPASSATTEDTSMQTAIPVVTPTTVTPSSQLNATQRNSINMLNYLVTLTQEINASKNSRLYLEGAYSTILNDISPEAVDNRTLVEINYLLDTLDKYRMISVKRERLEFIYEQNKAQALRDAVPNPLGLLSVVQSLDWKKLVASVAYMAVDAYTSYMSGTAQADLKYLEDNWALDDEQAISLHEIRKGTFNYMVETVRNYDIPGNLALNEQGVNSFVEWKGKSNHLQTIQYLEEHVTTYRAFGPYWLALAECYYENEDYQKCLESIEAYEELNTLIFRQDHSYAQALPLAIVSAEQVYDGKHYIDTVSRYAQGILNNTSNADWSLLYFTAQTYINLYAKTGDSAFIIKAYNIALSNVNYLLDEQKELNSVYLAEVQENAPNKGATEAQKKEITNLNKMLKEKRKTELPPIYEPLLLNCDLLFALIDTIDLSETESKRINRIIHENEELLFLIEPLDRLYWVGRETDATELPAASIAYNGTRITVPVNIVSAKASIKVVIQQDAETFEYTDWTIEKVERKVKDDVSTFVATYSSPSMQKHAHHPGEIVHIAVMPRANNSMGLQTCDFKTVWKSGFIGIGGWYEYLKVEE